MDVSVGFFKKSGVFVIFGNLILYTVFEFKAHDVFNLHCFFEITWLSYSCLWLCMLFLFCHLSMFIPDAFYGFSFLMKAKKFRKDIRSCYVDVSVGWKWAVHLIIFKKGNVFVLSENLILDTVFESFNLHCFLESYDCHTCIFIVVTKLCLFCFPILNCVFRNPGFQRY